MSSRDWANLEAGVRKSLRVGKQNGEIVMDVVTRVLWLERHKNQTRILALNETLRVANGDPMAVRSAPIKAVNVTFSRSKLVEFNV